jgi:hypothetical protein
VEVLKAAAVGAIIFTAPYADISNNFRLLNTSRANLRATQIMISRLEGLRLCGFGIFVLRKIQPLVVSIFNTSGRVAKI